MAGRPVVVYDDNGDTAAARAWWLLRWAGVERVSLLDGAPAAWRAAGLPVETGEPAPPPEGDVLLTAGRLPVLDADAAAEVARSGVLLDARAAERYRGETEPVDPRAGHIPGALSAPTGGHLAADGTFHTVEELARRFAALGADGTTEVGGYCGSGVTAADTVAALARVGITAALYPGAWSADTARPAAVGARPGWSATPPPSRTRPAGGQDRAATGDRRQHRACAGHRLRAASRARLHGPRAHHGGRFVLDMHIEVRKDGGVVVEPTAREALERLVDQFSAGLSGPCSAGAAAAV